MEKLTFEEFDLRMHNDFYRTELKYPKYVQNTTPEERAARQSAKDAYNKDSARLEEQFKADLFEAHGVSNNPKKDKAFSIAWSNGHANGLSEVASCFSELVDLIKD